MATNITPVDVFTTTITIPTDGDAVNGTEVALTTQALANRTENNNTRLTANDALIAGNTTRLDAVPRLNDGTFLVPLFSGMERNLASDGWLAGTPGIRNQADGAGMSWDITPMLPAVGSTIDSIVVTVGPAAFPNVSYPSGDLPFAQLMRVPHATPDAPVSLDSTDDPSSNQAEMDVQHTIVLSPAETILVDTNYELRIFGGGDTNYVAGGFGVAHIKVTWTL